MAESEKWMDGDEVGERAVTPADRRRLLWVVVASNLMCVLVLLLGAAVSPGKRNLILVIAAAYAMATVPIFIYFSRSTRRKVEDSQRRSLSG